MVLYIFFCLLDALIQIKPFLLFANFDCVISGASVPPKQQLVRHTHSGGYQ